MPLISLENLVNIFSGINLTYCCYSAVPTIAAEIESLPVPCIVSEATNAVCGADFTVWLSSVEGSSILYVLLEIQNQKY